MYGRQTNEAGKKMKILIACNWVLPHAGGVNTYVSQLTKGLQHAGHQVDVFSPTPDSQGFYIPARGLMIEKIKLRPIIAEKTNRFLNHHLPGLDPWIQHSEIERYCMEAAAAYFGLSDYDIIHAQDIISAHALSRVKPSTTALVTTIHGCLAKEWFFKLKEMGLPEQDMTSPLWHYSALRENIGATVSDVTISPSLWLKQVMVQDFSVPEQSIVVSPYGIDINHFRLGMMRDTGIEKDPMKKVFICPARFDVVKGHIHLLHALAKLKTDRSDWVCWLVGDGSLGEELKQTAQWLGLGNHVVFLGNRDDVPALIRQADFFVLPSMQDNQPFAVIEALIAGKPVIVSDAGGIPEMVEHSQTGLIFPAGNSDQLHFLLRSAIEDETLFQSISRQAQERAEDYWSLQRMTSNLLELFELARSKYAGQGISLEPQPAHEDIPQNVIQDGQHKRNNRTRTRGGTKWHLVRRRSTSKRAVRRRIARRRIARRRIARRSIARRRKHH